MLELGLHKHFHPNIHYIGYIEGKTQLLENIICDYNIDYNFLNFDIQGSELKALKGMSSYLNKVDYLYTQYLSYRIYEKSKKGCSFFK